MMSRCNNCGQNPIEYTLLFDKYTESPARIHIWDLSGGSPELIVNFKIDKDISDKTVLKPLFFCILCNSVLSVPITEKKYFKFYMKFGGLK